jgi:hypothetical protein
VQVRRECGLPLPAELGEPCVSALSAPDRLTVERPLARFGDLQLVTSTVCAPPTTRSMVVAANPTRTNSANCSAVNPLQQHDRFRDGTIFLENGAMNN